jgi:hypothetical protein
MYRNPEGTHHNSDNVSFFVSCHVLSVSLGILRTVPFLVVLSFCVCAAISSFGAHRDLQTALPLFLILLTPLDHIMNIQIVPYQGRYCYGPLYSTTE